MDANQALAVARLARQVEAHFGGVPQDVEWALLDGQPFPCSRRDP
jgi:phosphoenolpyruvate synthase/pyruvate phosphate dikinase